MKPSSIVLIIVDVDKVIAINHVDDSKTGGCKAKNYGRNAGVSDSWLHVSTADLEFSGWLLLWKIDRWSCYNRVQISEVLHTDSTHVCKHGKYAPPMNPPQPVVSDGQYARAFKAFLCDL